MKERSDKTVSRAKHAKDAKVTGLRPLSRANARDLRKISPFGRNDKSATLSELSVLGAISFLNSCCLSN
jgi:hypothetical protein